VGRSYDILIGENLLGQASSYTGLPAAPLALVVTNEVVAPLYADTLRQALRAHHSRVEMLVLPDGENHKTWHTLNLIFDALLGHGADRQTLLYALGGGVVGDMTGFAAACFMRGVDYVQIPTTLLAQVDSSVGGKTAINHPLGKNMIGAFHQPLRVVCDLGTLKSLPQRELQAGLAEVIKYGPVADADLFDWLESNLDRLLARDPVALTRAVRRSCEIKAEVVSQDEREGGLRAILNFGHTFGHAIESGMGYGSWLHGEAVACGMVMAAHLSAALRMAQPSDVDRLTHLIERAGLPVRGPALKHFADGMDAGNAANYTAWMRHDKKSSAGTIAYVLMEGLGRAKVQSVPDALVQQVIEDRCA
jgi:3-dehydroquinate synthase